MKRILLIGLAVTTLLYGCGEEKTDMCNVDYDRLHFLSLISGVKHLEKR